MGKLSAKAVDAATARVTQYKISDGDGLTLVVRPSGSRLWQLRYYFAGNEKTLSLGAYPLTSLKEAREQTLAARKLLRQSIDPSAEKKASRARLIESHENNFEAVAREWLEQRRHEWTDAHVALTIKSLEDNTFRDIGKMPIAEIDAPTLLAMLRKIEKRGALEVANRVKQRCGTSSNE